MKTIEMRNSGCYYDYLSDIHGVIMISKGHGVLVLNMLTRVSTAGRVVQPIDNLGGSISKRRRVQPRAVVLWGSLATSRI